jgi:ACR3 family arsenite transporter
MDHPGSERSAPVAPQGRVSGHLSRLDQLLPLWILLAMALGLLLGRLVPGLQTLLGSVQVGHTSLPIALGLLVMMYPVLAKVRYGELGSMARDRRLLSITLGLTWALEERWGHGQPLAKRTSVLADGPAFVCLARGTWLAGSAAARWA